MKLTRDERYRVFRGHDTALKRDERPEVEPGDKLVLSWSKGGKRIVRRKPKVEVEEELPTPTLWIEITSVTRKESEWQVRFRIVDRRPHFRYLRPVPGASKREPGLKTRLRPPEEARKPDPPPAWTPETERGYSGARQGAIDEDLGVEDWWLDRDYSRREVAVQNTVRQDRNRARSEVLRQERRLQNRRLAPRARRAVVRDLKEAEQRLADLEDAA